MSKNIVNILDDPPPIRGFKASLKNNDETIFRGVIHKSALAATDDGTFFEVVKCHGTIDSCETGTFDVNLKFGPDDLSDAEYEDLPQIRVENRATGRSIDPASAELDTLGLNHLSWHRGFMLISFVPL